MRALGAVVLLAEGCGRLGFDQAGVVASDAPMPDAADPGPLAAYSFTDVAGPTIADRSGHGNTLTLAQGAPTLTATGHAGGGLAFTTASDTFSTLTPAPAFALVTGFTMTTWVFPTVIPGSSESLVVSYHLDAPVSFPYGLEAFDYVHGTGEPSCYRTSGATEVDVAGTAVLPPNTWSFLACAYDGATLALYVDGVLANTLPATGAIDASGGQPALELGADDPGDRSAISTLDDVRVYGRALSANEIVAAMTTPVTP